VAENQRPKVHAGYLFAIRLLRFLVGAAIAFMIAARINHLHANWTNYCVSGVKFVTTSLFLRLADISSFDVSLGVSSGCLPE
jgi:hypothetical protein